MPAAIVTGATGILGREIVFDLGRNAQQWPTVHALSRSKKEDYPENVIHNHIDLTSSAEDMANELKNVRGDYIFFAAYLQKDSEQENWDVNGQMLSNFLEALAITGAIEQVKRIILVTGAKQYGVHLGAPKNPMLESDPWLNSPDRPPNFYYNQQNMLHAFCKKHGKEWVVTYPNDVIGYAVGNFMNLSLALGLYATVTKELGQEMVFPGSPAFYTMFDCFTSSKLHAKFCTWAALEPRAANQAFNVANGDVESWQKLWPQLARHFGLRVPSDQFNHSVDTMDLDPKPPIAEVASELGLVGQSITSQSKVEKQVDLIKWSQQSDVKQAWDRVADRDGLRKDVFEQATWGFLNFVLGRNYNLVLSLSKARQAGFQGYIDTWESLEEVFGELEAANILPKRS